MVLEEKAEEPKEGPVESRDRSAAKPMSPKGDIDAPCASPVAKDKGVALSPTPEDPPRSSSEHVSFALVL